MKYLKDKSIPIESFNFLSVLKLRICSKGHAQLRPSLDLRSSISLNNYAREASPNLEIQEYIEKMCSLEYYERHSCWRIKNGIKHCTGQQSNFNIWMSLPSLLIFEPEPESTLTNDIHPNGIELSKLY